MYYQHTCYACLTLFFNKKKAKILKTEPFFWWTLHNLFVYLNIFLRKSDLATSLKLFSLKGRLNILDRIML